MECFWRGLNFWAILSSSSLLFSWLLARKIFILSLFVGVDSSGFIRLGWIGDMSKAFKQKAKKNYFAIGDISCPAFPGEQIVFNAKGFNHLFYKGPRSGRTKINANLRIRLLGRAVELLKKSTVVQEEDFYNGYYRGKKKKYKFWAFEGVIKERRIKVIIRQIGKGQKHFWSVIPAWRKSRFGVKNYRKSLGACRQLKV